MILSEQAQKEAYQLTILVNHYNGVAKAFTEKLQEVIRTNLAIDLNSGNWYFNPETGEVTQHEQPTVPAE